MPGATDGWADVERILADVRPPVFPHRDFPITAYGAVGDGRTDATKALQAAIEACNAAGGGRVVVPEGTFLTGAIHLKSGVNLHVSEGATLAFSTDPAQYLPVVKTRYEGLEVLNYSPLIYAYGCTDIAITGSGTLDGQADWDNWWGWFHQCDEDFAKLRQQSAFGVPLAERVYGDG
jgi:polygalacturonase